MPGGNGQPSQPKPRQWETDLLQPIVENGELVGQQLERDESHQLFGDLEAILFRQGGAALVAAKREQLEDGTYVTVGYKVNVESFMPLAQQQAPQPPPPTGPVAGGSPDADEVPEAGPPDADTPEPEPPPSIPYQPTAEDEHPPEPVSATAGTEPAPATLE